MRENKLEFMENIAETVYIKGYDENHLNSRVQKISEFEFSALSQFEKRSQKIHVTLNVFIEKPQLEAILLKL